MFRMFRPTHIVLLSTGAYPVMLDTDADGAGPAYTAEEWQAEAPADIEFNGKIWTFQGDPSRVLGVEAATRTMRPTLTPPPGWTLRGFRRDLRRKHIHGGKPVPAHSGGFDNTGLYWCARDGEGA